MAGRGSARPGTRGSTVYQPPERLTIPRRHVAGPPARSPGAVMVPAMAPLVTVVIAAFNTERYVGTAIESCLAQTLDDLEVVVVDDGSTDGTLAVARGYETDPRVRVIACATNRGASHARNLALDAARGEWVAVLDSDDAMLPERLEVIVEGGRAFRAEMVGDDLLLVHDGETEPYATLFELAGVASPKAMLIDLDEVVECETGGSSKLRLGLTQPVIRRDFLERHGLRYDSTLTVGEDFLLYLECLLAGATWVMLPSAHYRYRQRAMSAVSSSQCLTVERKLKTCESLLARPLTAEARATLGRYRRNLRRELGYQRMVEALKEGRAVDAAVSVAQHPYALVRAGSRVPGVLKRRYDFYVRRDPHAFDMLPPAKQGS